MQDYHHHNILQLFLGTTEPLLRKLIVFCKGEEFTNWPLNPPDEGPDWPLNPPGEGPELKDPLG